MCLLRAPRVMGGIITRTYCPCGVGNPAANVPHAWGMKLTGEANRVPPASHK
jgi:hypothetical protein